MKKLYFSIALICLFAFGQSYNSYAQIQVTDTVTPLQMVENFVGNGIVFENVSYTGVNVARGAFTNGDSTNLGFDSGIFLTSGSYIYIPGPNGPGSCSAGSNNGMPGDALLTAIAGVTTYDASVLEFDFIPILDTINFRYVFGSEEYHDYVYSTYNDVFGCFITGPNPDGGDYMNKNMTIVPDTIAEIPVSINNVNNGQEWTCDVNVNGPCSNCEYFVDNMNGTTLEYDGLTVVLTAGLRVVPNEGYHIKIAIADAGDGIYDSGVFLEQNSFCSETSAEIFSYQFDSINNPGLPNDMIGEIFGGNYFGDSIAIKVPINYDLTNIIASFTLSNGADAYIDGELQESGITPNDFSNLIEYNVIGADSFEKTWYIYISYLPNNLNDILDFTFEAENNQYLEEDVIGVVSADSILMKVPFSSNPESLIASFMLSDNASAFVNGNMQYSGVTVNDFTNDMVYSIEAENGDTKEYTVYIENTDNEIEFFFFDDAYNPSLNEDVVGILTDSTVAMYVPIGTDITNLITNFVLSDEAEAYVNGVLQQNLITANDFTNPLTYQVISESGHEKNWLVTVYLLTGIPEETGSGFSIFPNPAKSIVHINCKLDGNLKLMDNEGRAINHFNWEIGLHQIDISGLQEGVYYLEFNNGGNVFTRKFIIAR